jgi:hypothetical protein
MKNINNKKVYSYYNNMILKFIYLILTLTYFSAIISYTYDIETNCDCDVKWYFRYLRYFSIAYITITIILFLYIIMLILSYNTNHIWYNGIMTYIILITVLIKTIGLVIYFYCYYSFEKTVSNNKDKCGCYRGNFYDVMRMSTNVYLGMVIGGLLFSLSYIISSRKTK